MYFYFHTNDGSYDHYYRIDGNSSPLYDDVYEALHVNATNPCINMVSFNYFGNESKYDLISEKRFNIIMEETTKNLNINIQFKHKFI